MVSQVFLVASAWFCPTCFSLCMRCAKLFGFCFDLVLVVVGLWFGANKARVVLRFLWFSEGALLENCGVVLRLKVWVRTHHGCLAHLMGRVMHCLSGV